MRLELFKIQHKGLLFVTLSVLLLLFAVYFNLGVLPFRSDDGLRGLVAFEMVKSGEYIVPQLWNETYLNKPPLFNWLIVLSYKLFGEWNLFSIRFATATSLIGFGIAIFLCLKLVYSDWKKPFLIALASISTSTILYEDAMVAEIDITFSLLIYCMFMCVYFLWKKDTLVMFILAYIFAALAFLMKGFPSIVFIAFTLFFYAWHQKQVKSLFSWKHLLGILSFIIVLSSYYTAYIFKFEGNWLDTFKTLWDQSTMRTVADDFSTFDYLSNFVKFPIKFLYSLLPWSILAICLFQKGIKTLISKSPILSFYLITFFVNIIIYWISPGNNFRYNLMFIPLVIGFLFEIYFELGEENRPKKITNIIFQYAGFLIPLALVVVFVFFPELITSNRLLLIFLVGFAIAIAFVSFKSKKHVAFAFLIVVLTAKGIFNIAILPKVADNMKERRFEKLAYHAFETTKDFPIKILQLCSINEDISLIFSIHRDEILERVYDIDDKSSLYMIDENQKKEFEAKGQIKKLYATFETRVIGREIYIVSFLSKASINP